MALTWMWSDLSVQHGQPRIFPINTPILKSLTTPISPSLGANGYLLTPSTSWTISCRIVTIQIVIVRTDYGTALDANRVQQFIASIMGRSTTGTGIWLSRRKWRCTARHVSSSAAIPGSCSSSIPLINAIGIGYPGPEYQISLCRAADQWRQPSVAQAHVVADHRVTSTTANSSSTVGVLI